MANHAQAKRPEGLLGEIVDDRYAVLELLGGNRYLVYDLKQLRQTVMPLGTEGIVLSFEATAVQPAAQAARPAEAPVALTQRKTPPPLPVELTQRKAPVALEQVKLKPPRRDATPMPPLQRRRVDTHRFEAAWFSHGELLENEEQVPDEVTDYDAYQSYLETIALKQR